MNKLKNLSQQHISMLLAFYIGIFLNISVFYRRFTLQLNVEKQLEALTEVVTILLFTFFVMRLLSLGGKLFFRISASLFVIISVAASYYMVFFNVVIGYGIIISVMTTDIDLSLEAIGFKFGLWVVAVSALPLLLIWRSSLNDTLLDQLKKPGQRISSLAVMIISALLVWLPLRMQDAEQKVYEKRTNTDLPSYGGVVAHSYLPSNWLAATGLFIYTQADENQDTRKLFDPAKQFTYVAPADIDQTYVVFIIGETTRWDHMGMLGYERDTTPKMAKEKNLLMFKGTSCDTATKLSLRCMFVREGGTKDNPQRTLKEQNVFSVMSSLGFSSELFAMQSEIWFYNNVNVNNYSFRETIASEKRNDGKPVDDMLLVNELSESIKNNPKGKHLVILHTKGSHYLYSQRYPAGFGTYKPECMGIDDSCSKAQLINSFDNSVLYTDSFIDSVINQLKDKNALVIYAADHGESIDENSHFHATPREMAPPEQFRIPIMVWASDKFLAQPEREQSFERLRAKQKNGQTLRHVELFDSILGCLGYTSPNGGINQGDNWCAGPVAAVDKPLQSQHAR
ncbi:kdo(2)-lipid A phosphoethanolamine 7''-transferase [Budvicia diplopodorum]|uniref:kdo(2)-lipid A phosphoethanolamine 7''-transferase n=1 Tax=Budvicia diplopodorum TaxID=1119056 RepID=UPI00135B20AF|nr:kdo(2)-lipid A phosphoethanolamine 7''-transferase [Budvicia diplopodorum]